MSSNGDASIPSSVETGEYLPLNVPEESDTMNRVSPVQDGSASPNPQPRNGIQPVDVVTSFSTHEGGEEIRPPNYAETALSDSITVGLNRAGSLQQRTTEFRLENVDPDECSLHQLAKDGDHQMMAVVLSRMSLQRAAKKVNRKDQDGFMPLHYAARYNHILTSEVLVSNGANVHARGEDAQTPLHMVAKFKSKKDNKSSETDIDGVDQDAHESADDNDETNHQLQQDMNNRMLNFLLSHGARVNDRDFYGLTALHHAAVRGNHECVRLLLACPGVDIEASDKQQMTPLHVASVYGHVEIFRLLVAAGANFRCKDNDNGTPLQFAAAEGNLEIVRLILDSAEQQGGRQELISLMDETDSDGSNALHLCVDNGHLPVAEHIIDRCIKHGHATAINARRNNRETALHLAASHGHLGVVQLLVSKGAAIDKRDDGLSTPLLLAARFNHHQVVEYLIKRGANIELHDADNFTPLLMAANYGHTETIPLLLRHKASVTAVDKNDKTVIYQCAEENRPDALKLLLRNKKARALLENTDRHDNTPLHVAAAEGHHTIVKILLERKATVDAKNEDEQTPLHLASERGNLRIVQLLCKHKKEIVNDDDENGDTPLHLAALSGRTNCVRELVALGASIKARNAKQWTPLDCCAFAGMHKSAIVLLEADCPVDPKDKRKVTPLHLACQFGHREMVELLIRWKADLSHRSVNGRNALDFAIDHGHSECAQAIIESENWRDALKNRCKGYNTVERIRTPMRKLVRKMPNVAEEVFRKCMRDNGKHQDDNDYQLYFDYEFLDDEYSSTFWFDMDDAASEYSVNMTDPDRIYDDNGYVTRGAIPYSTDTNLLLENHPLYIMVKSKRTQLLRHPLVISLLNYKWRSYGRLFYYSNLFIYILFLCALNSYMLTVPPPYAVNATATSASGCLVVLPESSYEGYWGTTCPRNYESWQPVAQIIILILASEGLLKELFQMISKKLSYLKSLTNLIELSLYILSILVVIDIELFGLRQDWQWECGAAALFFSWIGLLLFIQNFPRFGIYVLMFTDVFRTFVSFFAVFVLFILGFAFSFHVLIRNQNAFDKWWNSIIKTTVMMIGEFEYDAIFNSESGSAGQFDLQVEYEPITYILFVVFMIIMSIIIMNLLVGLAVDDIKEVQDNAELESLAMQVKLALDVEYTLPQFVRRRFLRKYRLYRPNTYRKRHAFVRWLHSEEHLNHHTIAEALNPEKSELENLEDRIDRIEKKMKDVRASIGKLSDQTRSISDVTTAIAAHFNIEWEKNKDDDDDERK